MQVKLTVNIRDECLRSGSPTVIHRMTAIYRAVIYRFDCKYQSDDSPNLKPYLNQNQNQNQSDCKIHFDTQIPFNNQERIKSLFLLQ